MQYSKLGASENKPGSHFRPVSCRVTGGEAFILLKTMASSGSSASSDSSRRSTSDNNSVLRNALRFSVSSKEEEMLRRYLKSRKADHQSAPSSSQTVDDKQNEVEEDYNVATVRIAGRLFISTYSALELWHLLISRFTRGDIQSV